MHKCRDFCFLSQQKAFIDFYFNFVHKTWTILLIVICIIRHMWSFRFYIVDMRSLWHKTEIRNMSFHLLNDVDSSCTFVTYYKTVNRSFKAISLDDHSEPIEPELPNLDEGNFRSTGRAFLREGPFRRTFRRAFTRASSPQPDDSRSKMRTRSMSTRTRGGRSRHAEVIRSYRRDNTLSNPLHDTYHPAWHFSTPYRHYSAFASLQLPLIHRSMWFVGPQCNLLSRFPSLFDFYSIIWRCLLCGQYLIQQ